MEGDSREFLISRRGHIIGVQGLVSGLTLCRFFIVRVLADSFASDGEPRLARSSQKTVEPRNALVGDDNRNWRQEKDLGGMV